MLVCTMHICQIYRKKKKDLGFIIRNVGKHEFLTEKDTLTEKDLLEKAATIKRF